MIPLVGSARMNYVPGRIWGFLGIVVLALAAAQAIGLPSNVWPSTKPGFVSIGPQKAFAIFFVQIMADNGA